MTKLEWAKTGEKEYETGVSNGVLYPRDNAGLYPEGFPWNGLTSVTDSPSGAESNKQYADNEVYVNIKSAEEVGGTIEAFMRPRQFAECDGTREPIPGLEFGQQTRRSFGFSWQSRVGNDVEGVDYGFKIHLVYGADANPSEKQYQTINDSPEPSALSWEYTTIPTASGIPGLRNVSKLTIKSTDLAPAALKALTDVLYGTESTQARLPLPREVYEICLAGEPVEISPAKPAFAAGVITIPTVAGAEYRIGGTTLEPGPQPAITEDTLVSVHPKAGYKFPAAYDNTWLFEA